MGLEKAELFNKFMLEIRGFLVQASFPLPAQG
jgi:hypothetical protein